MTSEFEVRDEVFNDLERYAVTCCDPEARFADFGNGPYNIGDVLREVRAGTDLGREFYNAWEAIYDYDNK